MTSTAGRPARTAARSAGYRCSECGWSTVKWVGRCGECQAWGSVADATVSPTRGVTTAATVAPAPRIGEVTLESTGAVPTGVGELDRVLGGGIVPGAVVLVAGEPGIGKSTLLLDVSARVARAGQTVLYVSGEESASQIRRRAERIEAVADGVHLAAETDLARVLGQIDAVSPSLVVIDSVQTIASLEAPGAAGNVTQVREVAASLVQVAKSRGISVLLVGHVTKDGSIAGPRLLEHVVDVVLSFEGDRHTALRLVRAVKNRYGPTDDVGCFELSEAGILGLADPSGLFLSTRDLHVPGTCVTVTLEGRRPLLAEIQSLVAGSTGHPRRVTNGLDGGRVAMVTAVLERRARAPLAGLDAYVSTVGGVRVGEPAADLAVALAVASSIHDRAVPADAIAFGEVGLAGEIRPASSPAKRLSQAVRLGFTTAFVPKGVHASGPIPSGIRVVEVASVAEAVARVLGQD